MDGPARADLIPIVKHILDEVKSLRDKIAEQKMKDNYPLYNQYADIIRGQLKLFNDKLPQHVSVLSAGEFSTLSQFNREVIAAIGKINKPGEAYYALNDIQTVYSVLSRL